MGRNLNGTVYQEVDNEVVRPAVFIDAMFTNPIYINSTGRNITHNGNSYVGAGAILGFDGVEETSDLGATGITLTLALSSDGGATDLLTKAVTEDYQNKSIKVYLGMLDTDGNIVGNAGSEKLITLFNGRMDIISIEDSGDGAYIKLNAESNLVRLGRTHSRRYTHQDQKNIYSSDRGFDLVNEIQEQQSVWGRNA